MMKRTVSLLGVVLTCVATSLSAQTAGESDVPDFRPFTVGLEAGVAFGDAIGADGLIIPNPGLAASWRFSDHFGARVGANGFLGLFDSEGFDMGDHEIEGINYDVTLKPWMSEQLALDYYPWKESTFRITVGALFMQGEVRGVVPQDPVFGRTFIPIGNNTAGYDSANIGDVNMEIEPNLVAPFVSIGMNFYLDNHKRWSLGGELGVAYTGTPEATLSTSTGLVPQQDLDIEAQQIEDGAWKFYPIVKIKVDYSF